MDNSNNNNGNRSLFLYGGLIFAVAIVLIIISFFGQSNVRNSQPETIAPDASISEKTSALSDENRILLEEKTALTAERDKLKEDLAAAVTNADILQNENNALKTENNLSSLLMQANAYIQAGNTKKAREILASVSPNALNGDQKIFYDTLTEESD